MKPTPSVLLRLARLRAIPAPSCRAPIPSSFRKLSTIGPRQANKTASNSSNLRPTAQLPQEGGNNPREVFNELDVLSGLPAPASSVQVVYTDGFRLNNGSLVQGDGVFLINNVIFRWKALLPEPPAAGEKAELDLASEKAKTRGLLELNDEVWGLLDVVYPKPDLLIIGTGYRTLLLHPENRKRLQDMGINIDVMDTNNAAAQYNLLATERPGAQIAAALLMSNFGR
ncbi:hypothetical protein DFH27DRAFT_486760 [Peziza echinospora]|nr:hypothetical protein DFH27DRAFT_486760 [Peziza echinospora]